MYIWVKRKRRLLNSQLGGLTFIFLALAIMEEDILDDELEFDDDFIDFYNDETALRKDKFVCSCLDGDVEAIRDFLKQGSDPCQRDRDERTAVHAAASSGNVACVLVLLENGGEVEPVDSYGITPLHWACATNGVEIVELLLKRGADPKRLIYRKQDALFLASVNGHARVVDKLS